MSASILNHSFKPALQVSASNISAINLVSRLNLEYEISDHTL